MEITKEEAEELIYNGEVEIRVLSCGKEYWEKLKIVN